MRREELKSSLTICGNLTTENEDVIIPPLQPCVVIASFCIGQKKKRPVKENGNKKAQVYYLMTCE